MKKKFGFWFIFMLQIVGILAAVFLISGFVMLGLFRAEPRGEAVPSRWLPVIFWVVTAASVTSFVLLVVSRRFFAPIEKLIEALKEVAAGNFQVSLPEIPYDSEINRMNLNFNKMVKELNSMETLQAGFIQNVSHEFKTPLASIEGYASILNQTADSPAIKDYSRKIMESAGKLSLLTGNILKLSKLENKQIISEKEEFFLDEQIRQAYLSLEPLWRNRDIDIEMEMPETSYFGNQDLIFQIWTNLFSNAVKFTPDGGCISAEIKETGQEICVEIKDTGIGMEEEVKAHIFERFYQGQTNRNTEGNGLGLAIVKKIVELCKGTIEVESQPDAGSLFRVRLPKEE